MKLAATNADLCKMFDIDPKRCQGFDLSVRHDAIPKLTVHSIVFTTSAVASKEQVFDLILRVPAPPPDLPKKEFDLDAECAAALKRLTTRLDAAAVSASIAVSIGFYLVRNSVLKRDLAGLLK
jgi:hypothetical protein